MAAESAQRGLFVRAVNGDRALVIRRPGFVTDRRATVDGQGLSIPFDAPFTATPRSWAGTQAFPALLAIEFLTIGHRYVRALQGQRETNLMLALYQGCVKMCPTLGFVLRGV